MFYVLIKTFHIWATQIDFRINPVESKIIKLEEPIKVEEEAPITKEEPKEEKMEVEEPLPEPEPVAEPVPVPGQGIANL